MNETFDFLKNRTKVNFVATIDGDRPSNRPFGDPVLFDNKIFELIINKYNLIKNETIFFDDKLENVIAANHCGIKSFIFNSIDDIKNNLE